MYIGIQLYNPCTSFDADEIWVVGYITNCPDATRAPKRTVYTISDPASLQLPDNTS